VRIRAYLPYADEKPAGLVRFSAHLVAALRSQGAEVELFFGQLGGRPRWAAGPATRVLFPGWLQHNPVLRLVLLPLRILWLQVGYPLAVRGYRDHPLLLLAHESAPFPWWDQVAVVHDLTALRSFSGRNTLLRRLHHALWLAGLRRSRHIIAISVATRDDLVSRYPELAPKTTVVHEGVDRSVFGEGAAPADDSVLEAFGITDRYLLYVGTLAAHKNIPFLVPVLARLAAAGDDVQLVLAGGHPVADQDALRRLAGEHGSAHRLVFPGYVDDGALAALMRRCDCFVFPSRNEGFGLAVVEAMACGAPVVSSSAGSLPEVVGEGGVLLSPDVETEWVRVISRVLGEPGYRAELRSRAVERAGQLSWDRAAEMYIDILGAPERSGETSAGRRMNAVASSSGGGA
jgi:glycosyltransferase involved in cell wall biosynthesis